MSELNNRELRLMMTQKYSMSDLKILCLDLDVDYEDVLGKTKSETVINIISHFRKHQITRDLINYVGYVSDGAPVNPDRRGFLRDLRLVMDSDRTDRVSAESASAIFTVARRLGAIHTEKGALSIAGVINRIIQKIEEVVVGATNEKISSLEKEVIDNFLDDSTRFSGLNQKTFYGDGNWDNKNLIKSMKEKQNKVLKDLEGVSVATLVASYEVFTKARINSYERGMFSVPSYLIVALKEISQVIGDLAEFVISEDFLNMVASARTSKEAAWYKNVIYPSLNYYVDAIDVAIGAYEKVESDNFIKGLF